METIKQDSVNWYGDRSFSEKADITPIKHVKARGKYIDEYRCVQTPNTRTLSSRFCDDDKIQGNFYSFLVKLPIPGLSELTTRSTIWLLPLIKLIKGSSHDEERTSLPQCLFPGWTKINRLPEINVVRYGTQAHES
jgi:hypothetical protein